MRLGYNTNGFASHSLADAIAVIAGIGYRSIAITLDHAALDPLALDHDARVKQCRQDLEVRGLDCVVETGARFLLDAWRKHQPTLLDPDPAQRNRRADFLRRAVDTACGLGASVVSLWSGSPPAMEPADALDARLCAELSRLCDYAHERGVVIGFEPEPGMHIESMAQFDRVASAVDHDALRLTLDIGHAHLTEDCGAAETVRRYADRIVNVHLEGMARPRHDHLVPWEGDLDVRAVVTTLAELGYDGPATFELSRHSHAAVDTARRAYDFITGPARSA